MGAFLKTVIFVYGVLAACVISCFITDWLGKDILKTLTDFFVSPEHMMSFLPLFILPFVIVKCGFWIFSSDDKNKSEQQN